MFSNLITFFKNPPKLAKFLTVAGVSAIFELVVYTTLFEILLISPVTSSTIAQVLSMIFNFILNKLFTFKTGRGFNLREAVGYLTIWGINLFVTTILMAYLIENTQIYPTVLRFGVMILMFFFNFFTLKHLVFKQKSLPSS